MKNKLHNKEINNDNNNNNTNNNNNNKIIIIRIIKLISGRPV